MINLLTYILKPTNDKFVKFLFFSQTMGEMLQAVQCLRPSLMRPHLERYNKPLQNVQTLKKNLKAFIKFWGKKSPRLKLVKNQNLTSATHSAKVITTMIIMRKLSPEKQLCELKMF